VIVAEYCGADGYVSKLLYDEEAESWSVADSVTGAHAATLLDVVEWLGAYLARAELHAPEAIGAALWAVGQGLRRLAEFTQLPTY